MGVERDPMMDGDSAGAVVKTLTGFLALLFVALETVAAFAGDMHMVTLMFSLSAMSFGIGLGWRRQRARRKKEITALGEEV